MRSAEIDALAEPPPHRDLEVMPSCWTPEHVAKRLVQAFVTLDLLPQRPGPRAPGGHWPRHRTEWGDLLGIDPTERKMREEAANRTVIHPSTLEITQMETVFDWLRELRVTDPGMATVASFWALRTARGQSIRRLCIEKHWCRATFFRLRAKALVMIAGWLNERCVRVF